MPWFTVSLVATAVLVQLLPGAAEALQFDRAAVAHGEYWRLLTGHLAHFDWNHLCWDAAVFLVVGALCERLSRAAWGATVVLAAVSITSVISLSQPQFAVYRGLSGIDCALFALYAGSLTQRGDWLGRVVGTAALVAVMAKSALEMQTGATVFASGAGYAPVPLAHLVGAGVGFVVSRIASRIERQAFIATRTQRTVDEASCSRAP